MKLPPICRQVESQLPAAADIRCLDATGSSQSEAAAVWLLPKACGLATTTWPAQSIARWTAQATPWFASSILDSLPIITRYRWAGTSLRVRSPVPVG